MDESSLRFTRDDVERAHTEWGCNCGPAALAAVCGGTLEEARGWLGPSWPRVTNVTSMREALGRTGRSFLFEARRFARIPNWPRYGLARIQFEGPWTAPGANPRWAYRHTHWVGAWTGRGEVQVFDINLVGSGVTRENGAGWAPLMWWADTVVAELTANIPRATGGWHITHSIEVTR